MALTIFEKKLSVKNARLSNAFETLNPRRALASNSNGRSPRRIVIEFSHGRQLSAVYGVALSDIESRELRDLVNFVIAKLSGLGESGK